MQLKRKGRKGYVAKTVFRLAKYIYYRLKRLTRKHIRQYAAKKLQIIIKYRHPRLNSKGAPTRRPALSNRLNTYRRTVPLYHPAHPNFLFIQFWHQLTKKALILQVIQVCKRVPRRILTTAKYISFEVSDFIRCHLRDWILSPPVLVDERLRNNRENLKREDTPLMADKPTASTFEYAADTNLDDGCSFFEPVDFMSFTTDYEYGKIPLKKTESPPKIKKTESPPKIKKTESSPRIKKTTVERQQVNSRTQRRPRISDLKVFHQRLKARVYKNDGRLRQTRIEDFFKPRASIDGATSRSAVKKHNAA